MTKTYRHLFFLLAAFTVLAACEKELEPTFPQPVAEYAFTNLLFEERVKDDNTGLFHFTIIMGTDGATYNDGSFGGSGQALSIEFVHEKGYFPTYIYASLPASKTQNGCYITERSKFINIGTGDQQPIEAGNITVTAAASGYSFSGNITVGGDKITISTPTLPLVYDSGEPTIVPLTTLNVFQSQANGTDPSLYTVTLKISNGLEYTPADYVTVWAETWSGTGGYLSLDLITASGLPDPGTYTAASNADTPKAGTFVLGYDTEMWGMSFTNWGSCWFDVVDGVGTGVHVTGGTVEVRGSGLTAEITLSNGQSFTAEYTGALTPAGGEAEPVTLTTLNMFQSQANATDASLFTVTLKVSDGLGFTPADYVTAWTDTWSGTGGYLSIDFITASGVVDAGTYKAASNTDTPAAGTFILGYDTEMWGMSFTNWGSCWFDVVDGVGTGIHVTGGSIEVTESGFTADISLSSGKDISASYTGPLSK